MAAATNVVTDYATPNTVADAWTVFAGGLFREVCTDLEISVVRSRAGVSATGKLMSLWSRAPSWKCLTRTGTRTSAAATLGGSLDLSLPARLLVAQRSGFARAHRRQPEAGRVAR